MTSMDLPLYGLRPPRVKVTGLFKAIDNLRSRSMNDLNWGCLWWLATLDDKGQYPRWSKWVNQLRERGAEGVECGGRGQAFENGGAIVGGGWWWWWVETCNILSCHAKGWFKKYRIRSGIDTDGNLYTSSNAGCVIFASLSGEGTPLVSIQVIASSMAFKKQIFSERNRQTTKPKSQSSTNTLNHGSRGTNFILTFSESAIEGGWCTESHRLLLLCYF